MAPGPQDLTDVAKTLCRQRNCCSLVKELGAGAWAARANAKRTVAKLRAALKDSLEEEAPGKGKRFRSGREAIRWLES